MVIRYRQVELYEAVDEILNILVWTIIWLLVHKIIWLLQSSQSLYIVFLLAIKYLQWLTILSFLILLINKPNVNVRIIIWKSRPFQICVLNKCPPWLMSQPYTPKGKKHILVWTIICKLHLYYSICVSILLKTIALKKNWGSKKWLLYDFLYKFWKLVNKMTIVLDISYFMRR